jgi:ribosome-binding factor A
MDVSLSIDGRHAKVYVGAGTEIDSDEFLKALKRDQGFYRSELASRLNTRHTPELLFIIDLTVERSLRLEQLLRDDDEPRTE